MRNTDSDNSDRFRVAVDATLRRGNVFSTREMNRYVLLWLLLLSFLNACSKSQDNPSTDNAGTLASATPATARQWIKGWRETARLSVTRAGTAAVAHNGFIYVIGGVDGREFTALVEFAKINDDGSLQEFKPAASLLEQRGFIDAVVYHGYLYVVGGGNGANGHNLLRSVERAKIMDDGSLSAWEMEKNQMVMPRRCSKIFEHQGYLYAAGGFAGALLDNVERAKIESDGHLSIWEMENDKMTIPRYVNSVSEIKLDDGKAVTFVIGGHDQLKGVGINNVESAVPNDKGEIGAWKASAALQVGRYGLSSAKYKHFLFALGGLTGLEYLDSVEVAEINQNGDLSPWRFNTPMVQARATFSTVVYKNVIYLIGGTNQDRYFDSVDYAEISDSGEIGFWGSEMEAKALENQRKTLASQNSDLPNHGLVKVVRQASMYTYVLVDSDQGEQWLAGPKLDVAVGNKVGYSKGVSMGNFFSKELQQEFPQILFVGKLQKE